MIRVDGHLKGERINWTTDKECCDSPMFEPTSNLHPISGCGIFDDEIIERIGKCSNCGKKMAERYIFACYLYEED